MQLSRVATLFLHGNAGNLTHRIDHATALKQAGCSVLVIDYRGYGKSDGVPTEKGLYLDAQAGYEWIKAAGFSGRQIVLHGESLGTAVGTELASRCECAALVLESPFASLGAIANMVFPLLGPTFVHGLTRARRSGK